MKESKVDYKLRNRPIHNLKKLSRNDKCWCGSKIKYKNCCYEKDSMYGTRYDQPIYRIDLAKLYKESKKEKNNNEE